jgi:hypothetical protein
MGRQILRDGILCRRAGDVDHVTDQLLPARTRVSGAARDQIEIVTGRAQALHMRLALTIRQLHRRLRAVSHRRQRHEIKRGSEL